MAVLDTIVFVGLLLQGPSAVEAQGTSSSSAGPHDPSLDRIRARLAEPLSITVPPGTSLFTTPPTGRALFKVEIQEKAMPPRDWLDTGTTIPAYVRPTYSPTHQTFWSARRPNCSAGSRSIRMACPS